MKETYLMWVRILPDDGTTRSRENSGYHIKHSTLAIFNSVPSHSASIPMLGREGFICRGKLKRGSCKGNFKKKKKTILKKKDKKLVFIELVIVFFCSSV